MTAVFRRNAARSVSGILIGPSPTGGLGTPGRYYFAGFIFHTGLSVSTFQQKLEDDLCNVFFNEKPEFAEECLYTPVTGSA